MLPMRKPATGEPCAGDPPARFGGRGGNFPTPIERRRAKNPRQSSHKPLTPPRAGATSPALPQSLADERLPRWRNW